MAQPEQREKIPSLPYSKGLAEVLKSSKEDAQKLNHRYLYSEVFFLGLMQDKDVLKALSQSKVDPLRIELNIEIVEQFIGFIEPNSQKEPKEPIGESHHLKKILELANIEANQTNAKEINPIHALIGAILVKETAKVINIGTVLWHMEITEEDIPDLREQAKELDLKPSA